MPEFVSCLKTEFMDRDRALAQLVGWAEKGTRWPVVEFGPEGCGKTVFLRQAAFAMKELSRLLRDVGHEGITFETDKALHLHDYQYHGPDPDAVLSKYTTRKSAAADVVELLQELARRVETLKGRIKWSDELEKALEDVRRALTR